MVAFRFTLIDPEAHKRTFEIHLDASKLEITIPWCKPSLPAGTIASLLGELNENRDLGTFIKGVRMAFIELVDNEGGV